MTAHLDRKQQVLAFFDAWRQGDPNGVTDWFTEDAVYENIPMSRVQGREEIRRIVTTWMEGLKDIDFTFRHIVVDGDVALMERHDVLPRPGGLMSLPIMATIEFDGAQIAAWREYFDLAQMNELLQNTRGDTNDGG